MPPLLRLTRTRTRTRARKTRLSKTRSRKGGRRLNLTQATGLLASFSREDTALRAVRAYTPLIDSLCAALGLEMNKDATGLNDLLKRTDAYKAWDDVLSYSQSHRADMMRMFAKGVPALAGISGASRSRSRSLLLQKGGGVPRVIRFILMLFIVLVLLETMYSTKKVYSGDAPYMNPMTQLFFMIGGTLNQVVDALGESSPAWFTGAVRFIWNIGKSTTNIPKNILPDLEIVPVDPIEERLSRLETSRTSVAVGESKYRSRVGTLFGDVKTATKELAIVEKKQEGFLERAQTAWGVLVGSSKAVVAPASEPEEPYSLENLNARMVAMQWRDTRIGRALNNTIYLDVARFSDQINSIQATDDSPAVVAGPMEMIDAIGAKVLSIQEIRAQGPEFANRVKDWVQANLMTALYTKLSMNIEMEIALTSGEMHSTVVVSQNTELNRNLYNRVKGDIKEKAHETLFNAFVDELKRRRLRPLESQRESVAKKLTDHFIDIRHVEYATPEDIKKWVDLKSASRFDRSYNALLNALWRVAFLGIPLTYFMHRIGMFKGGKKEDQAEMMRLFMALNNNMLQDREGGQRTITTRKRSGSRSRSRARSIKLIEGELGKSNENIE